MLIDCIGDLICFLAPNSFALLFMFGVMRGRDANDFCEEHPDVVLLCTSILSTEAVLTSLPMQRLKRNTLFVDVLSVKEFSKQLFLQVWGSLIIMSLG